MTLLDKLVNNSGLLQERHPTFVGRRPFASAATVAVPDAREQLVHLVSKRLLATFLTDVRSGLDDETRTRRMELFQERAGVQPPLLAPIDGRFRTAVIQPISTEPEDVGSAMQAYQAAIRQVMISPSTKKDGGVPDNLSAGAADGLRARGVRRRPRRPVGDARPAHGEHHATSTSSARWTPAARRPRAGRRASWWARRSARDARSSSSRPRRRWSSTSAALFGRRASRRSIPAPSARSGRPRSRRSTRPGAPTSPTPRAPRSSSGPPSGTLRARLDATLRGLDEWSKCATNDTLIDEAASIVERFAAGVNVEQLTENVVRALGVDLSLSDPTTNTIARALVLRHQDEVLEPVGEVRPRGAHAARRAADRGHPRGRRARVRPARRLRRDHRDPARVGRAGGGRAVARRAAVPDQDAHVDHRLAGAPGDRSRDRGHRRHRVPGRAELARGGAAGGDAGDPPVAVAVPAAGLPHLRPPLRGHGARDLGRARRPGRHGRARRRRGPQHLGRERLPARSHRPAGVAPARRLPGPDRLHRRGRPRRAAPAPAGGGLERRAHGGADPLERPDRGASAP